jgi:solute:Na+ symporter, SSS family
LFDRIFPEWFAGFSFAAIAIGALVPAAIMSIGAANLFTRNIWKPLLRPQISSREETTMAKIVSLVVKLGALLFIIFLPMQYAIDLQLLGGILMLQILPSIVLGLYRSPFRGNALFLGWLAGMAVGVWLFVLAGLKPVYAVHAFGNVFAVYIGILALITNFVVCFGGLLLSLFLANRGSSLASS